MRELSLFTGAGGGVLGSKLLGWTTVGYVEWEPYCQKVIKRRIEDGILDSAPIFGDIRKFNSENYAEQYKGMVDIITGGFPCQPFSVAGKKLGEYDERNMWPETIRAIRTIRPKYAFLENVPGLIVSGYFGTVLSDLHEMGYNVRWCVLSASDVGLCHKRERLWIFASDTMQGRLQGKTQFGGLCSSSSIESPIQGYPLVHPEWSNLLTSDKELRANDGVECWKHRISAIGNGQVPICMAAAFQILSEGII
jgi:DNA (cytosine-5)-methyltransferase 1